MRCRKVQRHEFSLQALFFVSSLNSFGFLGYISFANFRSKQMFDISKEQIRNRVVATPPTSQQPGSWDIESVWCCSRNATAASAQLLRGFDSSKLLRAAVGWGSSPAAGQQPGRWAALPPGQFAINDLTLNMCLVSCLRIEFWCKRNIPGPARGSASITGQSSYFCILKLVIVCYYSLIIDYYIIITSLLHRSIQLLHCYCTLIHHYYIIFTSLLHHYYYWICVITLLLHCYYTVITCYYCLVITLLLPVITYFIITCYYNIVGSLLPIFARSITGNNGSIITCFAPPHFADVINVHWLCCRYISDWFRNNSFCKLHYMW